jgi:hypothetical protein
MRAPRLVQRRGAAHSRCGSKNRSGGNGTRRIAVQHCFEKIIVFLFGSALWASSALAEESLVTLKSPAEGDALTAAKTYKVEYEVKAGTKAHHVHLFVDGEEVATGHKLVGSFPLGPLKPGERKICVAPVNKNHTPIGAKSCVTVTVQ